MCQIRQTVTNAMLWGDIASLKKKMLTIVMMSCGLCAMCANTWKVWNMYNNDVANACDKWQTTIGTMIMDIAVHDQSANLACHSMWHDSCRALHLHCDIPAPQHVSDRGAASKTVLGSLNAVSQGQDQQAVLLILLMLTQPQLYAESARTEQNRTQSAC